MEHKLPHLPAVSSSEPSPAVSEINGLNGLLCLIDNLPEEYQGAFYKQFRQLLDSFERRQRVLSYVQDTLNTMKLDIKYVVFDLEATRRERDEYKERLTADT